VYDPTFVLRGLIFDRELGHMLKVRSLFNLNVIAHSKIQKAFAFQAVF